MDDAKFVGFGKRLVAYMIDMLIIWLITVVFGVTYKLVGPAMTEQELGSAIIIIYMLAFLLYFTLMESSAKQGTLGKMLLKIKVVNAEGERISILNALGRYFGRILSGVIMGLGYIMILFTPKKQALHDKLAKTYVVSK